MTNHRSLFLLGLISIAMKVHPEPTAGLPTTSLTRQALALQLLSERLSSHPSIYALLRRLGHTLPKLQNPYTIPWGKPGISPRPISRKQMAAWQPAIDYLALQEELPAHADAMVVCGCDDLDVPRGAAAIYWTTEGEARVASAVTAGGVGWGTPEEWKNRGEGAVFAEEMIRTDARLLGRVLAETGSTNTQENVEKMRDLVAATGAKLDSVIVLQGPLYQRRSYLTAKKVLGSNTKVYSYAPYVPRLENFTPPARARILKDIVREVYRLRIYSGRFFETVEVPLNVLTIAREAALHLLSDRSLTDADRAETVKALGEFNRALNPPITPRFRPEAHAA